MKLEAGEGGLVVVQFAALVIVVLFLSSVSPDQSAQSTPVITKVYWGTSSQGVPLHEGGLVKVTQNETTVTAYFNVAFSTQVSGVSGSRLCVGPNSTQGESTTYTYIQFTYISSKGTGTIPLSPAGQQVGWVCTYTIKVTDSLSQTATWLGSVELAP
ncbi:MAG: hypothetical protein JRN23_02045 [Nitrososphaerota archaeon]|jgi:hypothetical protein|nr:hypothetical protein [Nitrososphaerota archaeon]MDG6978824.1 hypothetical protein [Nitrososphaerota archaeon]MDG7020696.1 hypothetical protein [Nitrososphaerota archaeon]MDG7022828.1 hypothetical protein [Nitrososphaerota archaeon]